VTPRPDGPPPSRPRCPHCDSGRGDARIVTHKGQTRTMTYVCDKCEHEWDVTYGKNSYLP